MSFVHISTAQDYTRHNWYFGNSPYGILFNKSDNQPNQTDTQATPFGNTASAVATDRLSGDLLFYTDGQYVYDASHTTMAGWSPPGLNANTAGNQGVAISPDPDSPGGFFIFANTANYPAPGSIFRTTVNMNLDGNAIAPQPPLGAITDQNNPAVLPGGVQVTPGMLVFAAGNDPYFYMMLVQDAATGEYKLYNITGTGTAILVKTIANPTSLIAANFTLHPQTGQIAVSPQNSGVNIQILQLDPAVDTLRFVREIPNTGNFDTAGEAIYDTEFSPDGTKLYISRFGDGSQAGILYRYDLTNPTASLEQVNPNSLFRSYGLQIGPDGRIYHLYQETSGGPILLGRIANPNDSLVTSVLYQNVPLGNDNYNGRQFPSFAGKTSVNFSPAGFEVVNANTCQRSPTKFYPIYEPPADFYQWDFGDAFSPNNNSNMIAPIHTYSQPGTYQVRLIAGINGKIDTSYQTVTVIQMTDSVDLGQDTVICPGESLILDAGPNGQQYRWSTGDTGQTITVDSSNATGYFWVVVDYGTCSSYDGINVEEYGEMVNTANYWYFGQNAGINFNEQPPVAVSDGQLNTPAGAATISDRNGNLLFYSDGNIVYDNTHVQMDNGINIGGENSSTQSVIIVPFPDDETLFYVFTTRPVYNASGDYVLNYAVVDIKELGGGTLGSVVTKEKPLFEKTTERITATNPGGMVWLIAHEMGNNTFRAYPITDQGIGTPVLTSIGSVHDLNNQDASKGYMKLSPDGTRLAVALSIGGKNYVELFDFDVQTGILSNYIQIELPDNNPPYQVYGVEFSSNSDKLFVTVLNPTSPDSKLYELKLHNYVKDSIEANISELVNETGVNMGAIQTGPDGQIYVARDGQQFLGTILVNLDTLTDSNYIPQGFDLVTGTSTLGLPNFIQSYFQQTPQATATVIPACVDQVSTFIGTGTSIIDQFLWTFGDGASATTDSASHIYVKDSLYTVAFNVSNRCGLDTTIVQQVDISGYPDEATIPDVDILCSGPLVLDADTLNTGGKTFIWNTGQTTQSIQVTNPGIFSVRIINAAGCESQDTTEVFDGRPPVDLGPNITICQGDSLVLDSGLPVGTPPNTFTWYRDGLNLSSNTSYYVVDTDTSGTFEYIVNVLDGLSGCTGEDTVYVTINPSPQATYNVTDANCGNADGQIDITSSLTNLTARWVDATNNTIGYGATLGSITAGSYTLEVTDNITTCSQNYAINVIDLAPQFTITTTPTPDCSGTILGVDLQSTALPPSSFAGGSYTLTEENTSQVFETDTITNDIGNSTVNFVIDSIPGGTYTLLVSGFGCTNQETGIVLTNMPTVDLSVSPIFDICSDNPTITASSNTSGNITYDWTGPNGFSAQGQTVNVGSGGSGVYFVTASTSGYCDSTASTQVNLEISPDPTIAPLTDGCDGTRQVGVTNLSGSNYSYLWSTGSSAPSVTITNSQQLIVEVRDQLTGCLGDDTLQVDVYQPLSVAVTVDRQACQDGNMVTLTATPSPAQTVSYSWFLNDIQLRDTTADVQTFNEGVYRAEVNTGNCMASGELEINRAPVTPGNIDPSYVICPEPPASEVAVIEPGDFITYLGYNQQTGDQIFETTPGIFEITEEGIYNFELENVFNCWTLDTTRVDVACIPTIYAPTAFSPFSSLPENQTFKIYPTYVADFEIFIYNRWGELIFYSDDLDRMINVGWDGTKNGKPLPFGTYAYVIRYTSIAEPERGRLEQKGGVTIIR